MRINAIRDKSVDVTLDASELVCLGNVLYFYEEYWAKDPNPSKPGTTFHGLYKQIITARDLAQYGHLDGHSLGAIVEQELAMNPAGQLNQKLEKLRAGILPPVDDDERQEG